MSNTDGQFVKKQLDTVRHPLSSQGAEHIRIMMNTVCTGSTVKTCVCGQEKYGLLGFAGDTYQVKQQIQSSSRAVSIRLVYDLKGRHWINFHANK